MRSGTTWVQQAYLKASNTEVNDLFRQSVAISGDTLIVGAYDEDSSTTEVNGDESNNDAPGAGAGYVFMRNGLIWVQQAYLKASNAGVGDNFSMSIAISENSIVIGAIGEDSNSIGVGGDQENNSASYSGAAYGFTIEQNPTLIYLPMIVNGYKYLIY